MGSVTSREVHMAEHTHEFDCKQCGAHLDSQRELDQHNHENHQNRSGTSGNSGFSGSSGSSGSTGGSNSSGGRVS